MFFTDLYVTADQLPDILQEVEIPIVNTTICKIVYAYRIKSDVTDNMICAGLLNQGGKDSCKVQY